ncbi:uncharacterized protein LOC144716563 isoform X2 [Wolffia australiana]
MPIQELDKYLNIPYSEEEDNPLTWWKDVRTRYFQNLTKIVYQFLAVSPTSAPVERLFLVGRDQYSYDFDDDSDDDDNLCAEQGETTGRQWTGLRCCYVLTFTQICR